MNIQNEIMYIFATKILNRMLRDGLITQLEYQEIDKLNLISFNPELAKLYI